MTAPPLDETPEIETEDVQGIAETVNETADAPDVETDETAHDETTDSAPTDAEGAEASAATPAPDAAAEPAPEPVPFAVNVFGEAYQLPGAQFDRASGAIKFADERAFQRTCQLLTKGREFETRGQRTIQALQRDVENAKAAQSSEQLAAAEYLTQWQHMMDPRLTDDEVVQFVLASRPQWGQIEVRAQNAHLQRELERARQAPETQYEEPDHQTLVESAQAGAAELVADLLANEAWATPEARADIVALMQDETLLNQFVYRARQDMPNGVRRGQWIADWDHAAKLAKSFMTPYQRAHQATASAQTQAASRIQATQNAAKTNARVLATAPSTTKPAARVAAPTTPARPMTTEEVRAKIDRDMDRTWDEHRRGR